MAKLVFEQFRRPGVKSRPLEPVGEPHDEAIALPAPIRALLAIPAVELSPAQEEELAAHYRTIAPALKPVRERMAELRKDIDRIGIPTALVLRERTGARTSTHVRIRGTQYAPFYVWNTSAGMASFLYRGGGFQGILADFGRPVVQHWPGVAFLRGDAITARYATRQITRLAPEANPMDVVEEIELKKTPGLHSAAVGVDPRTWEVVRFELWEEHPGEEGVYEVLHFSEPELDLITAG